MKAPGVTIRPIHQMSGGSEFNEVYLTDVVVSDEQRLVAVGAGWQVALVTLMNERVEGSKDRGPTTEEILALTQSVPRGRASVLDDSGFRQRFARWYVQAAGLAFTRFRTLTALSRGQTTRSGSFDREARRGQPVAGTHRRADRLSGAVRTDQ